MIINPIEVVNSGDIIKIQSLIEYSAKKEYLWYSVPKEYEQYITTERLDGFLVGLLMLAMKCGEDIEVKGSISEKLYFNLTNSYMKILQIVMPELKIVKITPNHLDDGKTSKSAGAVVTGFSAGVDSFCTIKQFYFDDSPKNYKITHFLFNNVGSHGEWHPEEARIIFNARYALLKTYPQKLGVPFIKVDSNISELLQRDFRQTHVSSNISVVLLLQKLFSKYYYSSGLKYTDCAFKAYGDVAIIDPMAIHLLSTETLECISTGCQYTRLEKTNLISEVPEINDWLNVCILPSHDAKNCSVCLKCCRTLLTLEVLGLIEKFDKAFDLNRWRKIRQTYLTIMLCNKDDPFIDEIKEYAKSKGHSFSIFQIAASKVFNFIFYDLKLVRFKFFVIAYKRKLASTKIEAAP